ncbi:beta-glucosidase [Marinifilum breve]|uniref:Beta-glucosidase n=1 Tax=Marinifilum breve TaxID=2184082 RepID=A0A2V3ZXS5_9BACT|nr:glucoamylase family protein [Marinifilum breve]PXY01259.1 beta-glucosidase [Marinifilum breve]
MLYRLKIYLPLILSLLIGCSSSSSNEYLPEPEDDKNTQLSDQELLDLVSEKSFDYFWGFAHPESGMIRERSNGSIDTVTTGGTGFGVMAIIVGIERNYITREEGLNRIMKITDFLENKATRYHGAWAHWLNGSTGKTIPFSQKDNGGDLVETSFLIQGLLTAREYFNSESENEKSLRNTITRLWEEVEWDWYAPTDDHLLWHWSPNYEFEMNLPIRSFNETMITYILALASPTHGIDPIVYKNGWIGSEYIKQLDPKKRNDRGGPLFFTHYSYLGLTPHIRDEHISLAGYQSYFDRNKQHTLLNREWCINQKSKYSYYGENCWGLTASDDPFGYMAHAPGNDNGTISPTAALSSIVYTPELSIKAIRHMYYDLSNYNLFGKYGFKDAFNFHEGWIAKSYLAIDQGPIVVMIENYRSGLIWKNFMKNNEISTALEKAGLELTQ